jgi:hypothetical protein
MLYHCARTLTRKRDVNELNLPDAATVLTMVPVPS